MKVIRDKGGRRAKGVQSNSQSDGHCVRWENLGVGQEIYAVIMFQSREGPQRL